MTVAVASTLVVMPSFGVLPKVIVHTRITTGSIETTTIYTGKTPTLATMGFPSVASAIKRGERESYKYKKEEAENPAKE